jgi:hypothetical protein
MLRVFTHVMPSKTAATPLALPAPTAMHIDVEAHEIPSACMDTADD